MTSLFTRYSGGVILVALVFVQLVLLGYQVRTDQNISLLRYWAVSAMAPVQKGLQGISGTTSGAWSRYFWLVDKAKKNRDLEAESARLHLENQWLRQSLRRFDREAELVAYQKDLASKTVLARVVAGGSSPSSKEVFLDRGEDQGIRSGMAVITADGIVGKVQASYASTCLVLLINDPESGAGIVLSDSRARGVLKGTGRRICKIDYISPETKVSTGELVYTSGDDRVYPRGLPVGKVTRVSRGVSFLDISVEPLAPLDRLEEALIVAMGVHLDLRRDAQPTPPEIMMAPARAWTRQLGNVESASTNRNRSASNLTTATGLGESSTITTDADRIKQQYRRIVGAQGTRVGSVTAPPPDFNFDPDAPPPLDLETGLPPTTPENPREQP